VARANRHYIPGHVWHLTHRCHKREFLGSRSFVEAVKMQMRSFAIGHRVQKNVEGFELQESQSLYKAFFDTEKNDIEGENLWFWNEQSGISEC